MDGVQKKIVKERMGLLPNLWELTRSRSRWSWVTGSTASLSTWFSRAIISQLTLPPRKQSVAADTEEQSVLSRESRHSWRSVLESNPRRCSLGSPIIRSSTARMASAIRNVTCTRASGLAASRSTVQGGVHVCENVNFCASFPYFSASWIETGKVSKFFQCHSTDRLCNLVRDYNSSVPSFARQLADTVLSSSQRVAVND